MRILFLTNFYLVHGSGGEEESCRQVVAGLKQRGHETLVLTSMHGSNNVPVEVDGVYRALYLEMDLVPWRHSITFFTRRKSREKHNLQVFERVLKQFDPDIIFIWGMWNLPYSLPVFAEARYPHKVVYRFASYWPTLPSQHELYWRTPGRNWYTRLLKQTLGHIALATLAREPSKPSLNFCNSICVSAACRNVLVESGMSVLNARIIHTGLDVKRFINDGEPARLYDGGQTLKLLYAGRIFPEKGIDTLIEALIELINNQGRRNIRLTLAGSGSVDYENSLRQLVYQAGLTDYVEFLGWVPADEMPALLRKFDVLLLPSIWPEPFSRAVLEGMISGLVVVATQTGGTPEVIANGENGLLFMPNDSSDLAKKIAQLIDNPELRNQIRDAGRQTILEGFTMTKMMDEIESFLQHVAHDSTMEKTNQGEMTHNLDNYANSSKREA